MKGKEEEEEEGGINESMKAEMTEISINQEQGWPRWRYHWIGDTRSLAGDRDRHAGYINEHQSKPRSWLNASYLVSDAGKVHVDATQLMYLVSQFIWDTNTAQLLSTIWQQCTSPPPPPPSSSSSSSPLFYFPEAIIQYNPVPIRLRFRHSYCFYIRWCYHWYLSLSLIDWEWMMADAADAVH